MEKEGDKECRPLRQVHKRGGNPTCPQPIDLRQKAVLDEAEHRQEKEAGEPKGQMGNRRAVCCKRLRRRSRQRTTGMRRDLVPIAADNLVPGADRSFYTCYFCREELEQGLMDALLLTERENMGKIEEAQGQRWLRAKNMMGDRKDNLSALLAALKNKAIDKERIWTGSRRKRSYQKRKIGNLVEIQGIGPLRTERYHRGMRKRLAVLKEFYAPEDER